MNSEHWGENYQNLFSTFENGCKYLTTYVCTMYILVCICIFVRSLMSRESTPAGGSKDFPPLAGVSREGSSLAGVSREGSSQSGVSREGSASRDTHSKESTPSDRSRHR